ncbi:PAS-domain containing protein [soil metagenome]
MIVSGGAVGGWTLGPDMGMPALVGVARWTAEALAGGRVLVHEDLVEVGDLPAALVPLRGLGVRFVAGQGVLSGRGAVCVFDRRPRRTAPDDAGTLRDLAALAVRLRLAEPAGPEELFERVGRLARLGYWRLEPATMRITWSDEVFRIYGYDRAEGQPSIEMGLASFPASAQTALRRGLVRALQVDEEFSVAASMTRRDGARRDVLIRFRGEWDDGAGRAQAVSGIMMDVTDARSLDERLARETALLQTTLDHMDQGLIVVESDLSIPVLSRRTAELLCLPPEFIETKPSFIELLDYQYESGSINKKVRESSENTYIINQEELPEAHVYERETFDGKILEVRTTRLPGRGFVRTFTDVSARRRREEDVLRAQNEYRMLFENSVSGIFRTTLDGRQLRANPALVRLNGYETEAELVRSVRDLAREWYVDRGRHAEFVRLMLRDGRVTDFVSEIYRHKSRERIWVSETAWLIRDEAGQPICFEGIVVEATERVTADAQVRHMLRHDLLTGLPNRLFFNEQLDLELLRAKAQGTLLAMLFLDLDRFKIVNDTLGHAAGDHVLRAIAIRLTGLVRREDTIARLGGDEFAVLMPEALEPEDAASLAERIIEALSRPVDIDGRAISVGVSIGIVVAPEHATSPTQMMKSADLALYRAKYDGRGSYCFFEPGMDAEVQERQRLEMDLRAAIGRGEFSLSYQPIVSLPSRRVLSYEALLRWRHPRRGLVPTETLIAVAEESRLIVPIGDWVLERACGDAAAWPEDIDLSVNVSAIQFAQSDFGARPSSTLDRTGLPPGRLVLEITETSLIEARHDMPGSLKALRARGLRTALDDFGTGYSSLGYLRSYAFDFLKIDGSFTARLDDPDTAAIVATLLALAKRLGIPTIVEGVETEAQLAWLEAEGCTLVQGHLTGGPRSFEEISRPGGRARLSG